MKLVNDARNLWRRWSTRIAAFQVVTFAAFWAIIPQDLRDAVPSNAKFGIVILLGVAFIAAQAISQPRLRKCKDKDRDRDA